MIALIAFLGSFALAFVVTGILLRTQVARQFIDVPNERSSHEVPKPRFGGIAIVSAFLACFAFLAYVEPGVREFVPLVAGGIMLFVAGIVDDQRGLGVTLRFGVQIAAAAAVVISGSVIDAFYVPAVGEISLSWMSIPVTILFVLTCINFYNFIDGIDGLAAGSAFIAALSLSLVCLMLGHGPLGLVYLALAGAAVGFLQFNFPPSRLFMGDSGSTFLGFAFAYLAIKGNSLAPPITLFIPLLVLSPLFLDAGLTLLNRVMQRQNVFQAHHTHYYQRLLSLGLTHKQITLLEYSLVTVLGASAVLYYKAGHYFALFLAVSWLLLFTALILKVRSLERGDRMFWERRGMFVVGADVVAIVVAFVGAYLLRMNFQFTAAEGKAMLKLLPVVVVVRSAAFYAYGLYRSVWKYTTTADVIRVIKSVTVGSATSVAIAVLLFRFEALPRTLFVIEFFLLTLLVLGNRFAVRWFHEIGREGDGHTGVRMAVVGAGDAGERLAREVRNAGATVVCFLEDDTTRIGLLLHSAPIEGPITRLAEICHNHEVDRVVIGLDDPDDDRLSLVADLAHGAGVDVERRATEVLRAASNGVPAVTLDDEHRAHFRGKRVLVTGADPAVQRALAHQLWESGAAVTIQCGATNAATRTHREATVFLAETGSPENWEQLLDRCEPDVVIRVQSATINGDRNLEEYLWRHLVDETRWLCDAAAYRPVEMVLMTLWNERLTETEAGRLAAASEAVLLNARAARARARTVRVSDDTGAAGIAILAVRAGAGEEAMVANGVGGEAPAFAGERTRALGDGLMSIDSPLYPAGERVAAGISDTRRLGGDIAVRSEWLRVVTTPLLEAREGSGDLFGSSTLGSAG